MRYVCFVFLVIGLLSCQEDSILNLDSPTTATGRQWVDVDPLLVPHFINFEEAAFERGFDIDLSITGITANIEEIQESDIAGQCTYGVHRLSPKEILIDETFWNQASELYREYIIFHELGHCHLLRDHNDQCTSLGIWESIMRSGTVRGCRDSYNNRTRAAYLDELFAPNNLQKTKSPIR